MSVNIIKRNVLKKPTSNNTTPLRKKKPSTVINHTDKKAQRKTLNLKPYLAKQNVSPK